MAIVRVCTFSPACLLMVTSMARSLRWVFCPGCPVHWGTRGNSASQPRGPQKPTHFSAFSHFPTQKAILSSRPKIRFSPRSLASFDKGSWEQIWLVGRSLLVACGASGRVEWLEVGTEVWAHTGPCSTKVPADHTRLRPSSHPWLPDSKGSAHLLYSSMDTSPFRTSTSERAHKAKVSISLQFCRVWFKTREHTPGAARNLNPFSFHLISTHPRGKYFCWLAYPGGLLFKKYVCVLFPLLSHRKGSRCAHPFTSSVSSERWNSLMSAHEGHRDTAHGVLGSPPRQATPD